MKSYVYGEASNTCSKRWNITDAVFAIVTQSEANHSSETRQKKCVEEHCKFFELNNCLL